MPLNQSAYFDYAAATSVDSAVLTAMQPYFTQSFHNPSALYQAAREASQALEQARGQIAYMLGSRPSEIIFTAGGTESDNLAIHGVMRRFPGANIVVSAIEHEAVLAPAARYDRRLVPLSAEGVVSLDELSAMIDDQTVLLSIMQANNEIGTVQPITKISQVVQAVRSDRRRRRITMPLYLHSDACQAANYLDVHVSRLGVDLLTLNGGKMYGPKQSGLLYVKGGLQLEPLLDGGGQERNLRSGTENVAGCVGLAAALMAAQGMRHDESKRLHQLQQLFFDQLQQKLPQAVVRGSRKSRLPNNVHFTLPGYDNERLLIQLDEAGIQAAAGSACSASDVDPSHVLRAIGLSKEEARASLRFTMGRSTTAQQINQVIDTLQRLVA